MWNTFLKVWYAILWGKNLWVVIVLYNKLTWKIQKNTKLRKKDLGDSLFTLIMDYWLWIPHLFEKFQNAFFFQDIKNSFHGVTWMGLWEIGLFLQT